MSAVNKRQENELQLSQSATTSGAGGMRMAPRRGRDHALLVVADFNSIHKPPASFKFNSILCVLPVTVEPFQFSPADPVAYELSYPTRTSRN